MPLLKNVLQGTCLEDKYIPDFGDLRKIVNQLKEGGFKIALTQGVWDMFHVGHGRYLNQAKSYADVLIVGVDSDELTKQMKGKDRPFDIFEERIEILSMLGSVNIITRRHTDQEKYDLIRLVSPDVLIMSKTTSSFTEEDKKALEKFCGQIEHLEAKAATSTTAKTLRLMTNGAKDLAEWLQKAVTDYFRQSGGRDE